MVPQRGRGRRAAALPARRAGRTQRLPDAAGRAGRPPPGRLLRPARVRQLRHPRRPLAVDGRAVHGRAGRRPRRPRPRPGASLRQLVGRHARDAVRARQGPAAREHDHRREPGQQPPLERDLPGAARRDAGGGARADRAARGRRQDALPGVRGGDAAVLPAARLPARSVAGLRHALVRPHGDADLPLHGRAERVPDHRDAARLGRHGPARRDPGAGADHVRRVRRVPARPHARGGGAHPRQPAQDHPRRVAPVLRRAARPRGCRSRTTSWPTAEA